jgi:Antitoxin Xre/MbcA/ParS C-terminal toxin-binding domain
LTEGTDGATKSIRMTRTSSPVGSAFPEVPEKDDLEEEAREVAGEPWLHTENSRLGGEKPVEVIARGEEGKALVRDILRSIRYVGSS